MTDDSHNENVLSRLEAIAARGATNYREMIEELVRRARRITDLEGALREIVDGAYSASRARATALKALRDVDSVCTAKSPREALAEALGPAPSVTGATRPSDAQVRCISCKETQAAPGEYRTCLSGEREGRACKWEACTNEASPFGPKCPAGDECENKVFLEEYERVDAQHGALQRKNGIVTENIRRLGEALGLREGKHTADQIALIAIERLVLAPRPETPLPSVLAGNDAAFERGRIVAWLRDRSCTPEIERILENLAERIVLGEHMTTQTGGTPP